MSTPASTTSFVLRSKAPPMISEAWRQAIARTGDTRDHLGTRLGLVEIILRYLVAVLATEVAGLKDHPDTKNYSALLEKLGRNPSWGDWSRAAVELAKVVANSSLPVVAPEFANVFWERQKRGKPKPSKAQDAFKKFVEIRNRVVHPTNGSIMPNPTEAGIYLEKTEAYLRDITLAARVFEQYPLYCCTKIRRRQGQKPRATFLHLSGTDFEQSELEVRMEFPIPEEAPFIISRNGEGNVLLLSPFVVAGPSPERHEWSVRLLQSEGKDQLLYTDGIKRESAPFNQVDEQRWVPVTRLTTRQIDHARLDNALNADEVMGLQDLDTKIERIDNYDIKSLLGKGASGRVYLASDENGRLVALKCLHRPVVADPQFRKRLKDEHRTMSKLTHPNIARVYGYGDDEQHGPYVVLEYIEGVDLASRVARERLSPDDAGRLAVNVLKGLAAAHDAGIVHRDVKPENIMVDKQGNPRLLDFGVAWTEWSDRLTRTADAVGTVMFAAPEQLHGGEVDERADIFSMGRTIEFLLTGDAGPSAQSKLVEGLRAIVRKATQPKPVHRWATAKEMQDALVERMGAGWKGCPVHSGDLLNHNYQLYDLQGTLETVPDKTPSRKHWVFWGQELTTENTVGILIAEAGESSILGRIGRDWTNETGKRGSTGYSTVQQTAEGMEFAVFYTSNPLKSAQDFLGHQEGSRGADPDENSVPSTDPINITTALLPEPLAKLAWLNPRADVLWVFEVVQRLKTLLRFLIDHRNGDRIRVRRSHGLPSRRSCWQASDKEGSPNETARTSVYKKLMTRRHEIAHGRQRVPDDGIPSKDEQQLIHELLEDAKGLLAKVEIDKLAPALIDHPDIGWSILAKMGSKVRYVALDGQSLLTAVIPDEFDDAVFRLIRSEAENSDSAGLQKSAQRNHFLLSRKIRNKLQKWELATTTTIEEVITVGSQQIDVDVVVRDSSHDVLAVVEIKLQLADRKNLSGIERVVWHSARTLNSRFALITDGNEWHWYAVNRDKGLIALDGQPDSLESPAFEAGTGPSEKRSWTVEETDQIFRESTMPGQKEFLDFCLEHSAGGKIVRPNNRTTQATVSFFVDVERDGQQRQLVLFYWPINWSHLTVRLWRLARFISDDDLNALKELLKSLFGDDLDPDGRSPSLPNDKVPHHLNHLHEIVQWIRPRLQPYQHHDE